MQPIVTIINFSHPITDSQKGQILSLMGHPPVGAAGELVEVVDIKIQFDPKEKGNAAASYLRNFCGGLAEQVNDIYEASNCPVVINLPGYAPVATLLLVTIEEDYQPLPFLLMQSRKEASTVVYDIIAIVGM
jgi:hypothetical protein